MSKNIRVFVVSPDTQSERIYPLSLTVAELKVGTTSSTRSAPVTLKSRNSEVQASICHWHTSRLSIVNTTACPKRVAISAA